MNAKTNSKTETPNDDNDGNDDAATDKTSIRKKEPSLPQELIELVYELRETVKRIDPRKHTPKTLRRALSTAGDILSDIERLTMQKPSS